MNGTYQLNQETQRVELQFAKADYQALSADNKAQIKSRYQWSGFAGAWVSRTRQPMLAGHYGAVQLAQRLGMTQAEAVGVLLTVAEQMEQRQERAANRAERFSDRAHSAEQQSAGLINRAVSMLDCIPMGQPVHVGHHSERGHRALLSRSDNAMRAGIEAGDKAEYYADRAQAATTTANAKELSDPAFLTRRIKEHTANLRRMERQGNSEWADQYREKVAYYADMLLATGGAAHDKESLKAGRIGYVLYGRKWYPVARINAQTVTVYNWLDIASFDWKVPFAEIEGTRPVDSAELIYDRDGRPVLPKIKH